MNILGKFILSSLIVGVFSVVPAFADSTDSFTFTSNLGNLGSSDTFKSGAASLTFAGYGDPGMVSNLFEKNEGPSEMGIGLALGTDHEIAGPFVLQMDLQQILALNPSSVILGVNSIQGPDTYQIWGSKTAGNAGKLLATNQTSTSFNLSKDLQYRYITVASPTGSVLVDSLVATVPGFDSTPEPGSAALLLFGLAGLVGLTALVKK